MTSGNEPTTKSEWKHETETDSLLNNKKNVSTLNADHIHGNGDDQKINGFFSDAFDTLSLAVPIFISRLSWVGVGAFFAGPSLHLYTLVFYFECFSRNTQILICFLSYLFQPSFLSNQMTTTDTSLLGHVGANALTAQALSDLWTMCTGVFIQGRVLSIVCGQAVGANNLKLAATYLQVSIVVLGSISALVIL